MSERGDVLFRDRGRLPCSIHEISSDLMQLFLYQQLYQWWFRKISLPYRSEGFGLRQYGQFCWNMQPRKKAVQDIWSRLCLFRASTLCSKLCPRGSLGGQCHMEMCLQSQKLLDKPYRCNSPTSKKLRGKFVCEGHSMGTASKTTLYQTLL